MNRGAISLFIDKNMFDIRIRPYPPSFSRTAARIIDPATGASTWAFGNQRCVIYIGIFTINAIIVINHHILVISMGIWELILNSMEVDDFFIEIIIRLIRRGREAVIVYIIR